MSIKNIRKLAYVPMAALVLSGSTLFAASSESAEASRLLGEVRSMAHELNRDAATLASYTRGRLSTKSHADRLSRAKHNVNAIGDRLNSLQTMKASVAPWQQEAIDSLAPVAAKLASSTQAAIVHLNENPGQLFVPSYTGHLSAIAENADRMQESVNVFLDAAGTQDRLHGLRDKAAALRS